MATLPISRYVTRVRLRVDRRTAANPCRYVDGLGVVREVPMLRLVTTTRLYLPAGPSVTPDYPLALIDTGAWISAIRPDTWPTLLEDGLIEPLPFADGGDRVAHLAGVSTGYRLGRLRVGVLDLLGPSERAPGEPMFRELAPVPVVAQLLLDPRLDHLQMPFPVVLGLYAGVLDGRRVRREPVPPAPPARATDAGPAHAQEWFLEAA